MRAASCFSGIGGAECGLPEADWLWCAEIEKFPSAVLATRFGHPNLGDITAADFIDRALAFGPLDLLAGGPPCQAFSVAGLRGGMSDPRGQLSIRFLEIAHAIRPRNLLVENVPGWLNHEDNAFGCFLAGLVGASDALLPSERPARGKSNYLWRWRPAGKYPVLDDDGEPTGEERERAAAHIPRWPSAGMVAGPWSRAAWRVLDAQYAGLAQRRQRVFLVADFGEGADPVSVLFERRGMHGNHPPRREEGQGIAGTLSARAEGGGGLGTDFDLAGGLQPVGFGGGNTSGPIDVAACLTAKGQRIDFEVETFVADTARTLLAKGNDSMAEDMDTYVATVSGTLPAGGNQTGGDRQPGMSADTCDTMLLAHTPRGEGFDASEDGTGRGTPLVPVAFPERMSATQYGTGEDISPTLGAANPTAIAFSCKDYGADATEGLSPTLRAMGHSSSHANAGGQMAVCFDMRGREGGAQFEGPHGTANIRAANGGSSRSYVVQEWAVRRLTVTECERLQGYPDGHTLIETDKRRTVDEDEAAYLAAKGAHVVIGNDGKLSTNAAADGPRYKALGNAWAVACVRPILLNIRSAQPDLFWGRG